MDWKAEGVISSYTSRPNSLCGKRGLITQSFCVSHHHRTIHPNIINSVDISWILSYFHVKYELNLLDLKFQLDEAAVMKQSSDPSFLVFLHVTHSTKWETLNFLGRGHCFQMANRKRAIVYFHVLKNDINAIWFWAQIPNPTLPMISMTKHICFQVFWQRGIFTRGVENGVVS